MLPVNLLNALQEYALAQKSLPLPTVDAVAKTGQQFELGQKLQGIVQAQVAPNVFKVSVSGQLVQMELPSSISSGNTVALQVISLQPRLTFSMVNSATPLSTPEQLGATARMLSSMSQQAPEKAYVRAAQSAPLWGTPQPPQSKQLAGMLQEALSNSGLFYESHQAQWLGGARSTAQLMHEPQNLTPEQARAVTADNPVSKALMADNTVGKAVVPGDAAGKSVMMGDAVNKANVADNATGKAALTSHTASKAVMTDTTSNAMVSNDKANPAVSTHKAADVNAPTQLSTSSLPEGKTLGIPDHLQPLVQQQLNALETNQMMWQGNIWPGQDMQWQVHEQAPQTPGMEQQKQWVTQIKLDLPNLGVVAATLRFNSAGLGLTLNASTPQTRALLGSASTRLVSALSDAGVSVISAQVSNEQP